MMQESLVFWLYALNASISDVNIVKEFVYNSQGKGSMSMHSNFLRELSKRESFIYQQKIGKVVKVKSLQSCSYV